MLDTDRTVVRTKAELQDQVDMKQPLILSLLLLGTVSASYLGKSFPFILIDHSPFPSLPPFWLLLLLP